MWGKSNDSFKPLTMTTAAEPRPAGVDRTQPDRAQAPPPPVSAPASIGKTTRIQGDIYSEEELYFDGEIEGSIEVRHVLNVGPNGKIKANVKARELVVSGIDHRQRRGSRSNLDHERRSIVGDVKTAGIVIEDGAYLEGGIDILRPEAAKAASSAKA